MYLNDVHKKMHCAKMYSWNKLKDNLEIKMQGMCDKNFQ